MLTSGGPQGSISVRAASDVWASPPEGPAIGGAGEAGMAASCGDARMDSVVWLVPSVEGLFMVSLPVVAVAPPAVVPVAPPVPSSDTACFWEGESSARPNSILCSGCLSVRWCVLPCFSQHVG